MINETLSALLSVAGRDVQLPANVEFSGGADPVLPTPFRITQAAAASLGAVGLAVSDLWELRTGNRQDVGVNPRQATASLRSGQYMTIDGPPGGRERNSSRWRESTRPKTAVGATCTAISPTTAPRH